MPICPTCEKSFTRNASLRSHILTVHEKQRPYECDVCSKRLASPSSLNRHKQIKHGVYKVKNKINSDVEHNWWCCSQKKETKSDDSP